MNWTGTSVKTLSRFFLPADDTSSCAMKNVYLYMPLIAVIRKTPAKLPKTLTQQNR